MKTRFLIFALLSLFTLPAHGQMRWLVPPGDSVKVDYYNSRNGLPAIEKGGKTGYITLDESWELFDYTFFAPAFHDLAIIKKNGLFGLFDLKTREERVPCVYGNITAFNEHLYLVSNYGQTALIRPDNSMVTDYRNTCSIKNAYSIILVCDNECWKILKPTGEPLNGLCYDLLSQNGNYPLMKYKRGSKYGLLDGNGTELTPALYEDIDDNTASASVFIVKMKGKWGLVDSTGAVRIPPDYEKVTRLSDNYYSAKKDTITHWYRADGQLLKLPTTGKAEYRGAHFFYFGDTLWNALTGILLTQYKPRYFNNSDVAPLIATDKNLSQNVYLLPSGTPLFDAVTDNPQNYQMGFSATGLMGKGGILNEQGAWVVPPQYVFAKVIPLGSTPYFIVSEDGKLFKVLDRNGQILINGLSFEPTEVVPAGASHFIVRHKALRYIVDANGRQLLETGFQNIKCIGHNRFVVLDNKISGVIVVE